MTDLRLSQQVAEVALAGDDPSLRLSQRVAEVVVTSTREFHASQALVEVVLSHVREAHVYQALFEVVVTDRTLGAGAQRIQVGDGVRQPDVDSILAA